MAITKSTKGVVMEPVLGVAILDDRPRHIKAVITQQRRGLTTKNKNHKIA